MPAKPDPLDSSREMRKKLLKLLLIHEAFRYTSDKHGIRLWKLRMRGVDEMFLPDDKPMCHLEPDQVDYPDLSSTISECPT